MKINKQVSEIINSAQTLNNGFEDILELSKNCKFSDCTHTTEPNCAIKKSIFEGTISQERFNNYYRIKNEAEYVCDKSNKTKAIDYMKKLKLFEKP